MPLHCIRIARTHRSGCAALWFRIAKAEADKQVAITNAEAEAQKTSIAADAQAEANRKLAESLSDTLIDYQKIQKWDGKGSTYFT